MLTKQLDLLDMIYAEALEAIAAGATRAETFDALRKRSDGLVSDDAVRTEMGQALTDAKRQGVEREDIDPSWF